MPKTNVNIAERNNRRFNDWLRGEMVLKKLHHEDISSYLKIHRSTFTQKLNGHAEWTFKEVLEILDYFNATLEEIL